MKKLILALSMVGAMVMLAGCTSIVPPETQTEFEIASENMDALENYTIEMTLSNVPLFGSIVGVIKIEDGKTETTIIGMTMYSLLEDDKLYTIDEFEEVTYAFLDVDVEESDIFENFVVGEFAEEDFTVNEDGEYVANGIVDELDELILVIEEGYFVEMRFAAVSGDTVLDAVIVFEDFNDTEVDFPIYEMADPVISALYYFDSIGFSYYYEGTLDAITSVDFSTYGGTVRYSLGDDFYVVTVETDIFKYYPETAEWMPMLGNRVPVQTYVDEGFALLTGGGFTILDDLYNFLNE